MSISRVLTRSRAVLRLPRGLRTSEAPTGFRRLARWPAAVSVQTSRRIKAVWSRGEASTNGGVFIDVARITPGSAPLVRACRSHRSAAHNVWSVGGDRARLLGSRAIDRSAWATRPRRTAPEIGVPLRRRCRVILERRSRARCPIWRSLGAGEGPRPVSLRRRTGR